MSKSTSALALALLASACATAGPDFARPAAPTATGYAMAGDPSATKAILSPEARTAGPWWSELGSAELDKLIRAAFTGSPDIAITEANLRAALAEARGVSGERRLQADFDGSAQRQRINVESFGFQGFPSPTINLYRLGLSGRYDLDLFGKKRRASEAAHARAEAEARRADAAYLTLSANVALQAVRIATLRAQIASVTAITEGDQRVIDMIERAQLAGGAPRSASSLGETQLAQDLALLPPLERELSEARHQLALLIGRSPVEWAAPDFNLGDFADPATIPVAMPSALVRKRPDILEAEAELHAATADIGVATASMYPDISISANITQSALEPGDLFGYSASGWAIGAGVTGPLLRGGSLKARQQKAVAEAEATEAEYRRTVLRAFAQVSDALAGVAYSDRSVAAQARAERAADANFQNARRAFELGAGPLLDVFDAGRQRNLAERLRIEAQGRRLEDIIRLYAATGADWR